MERQPRRFTGRLLLGLDVLAANVAAATCVLLFLRPDLVGIDLGAGGMTVPLPGGHRLAILPLDTGAAWAVLVAALLLLLANVVWLLRRKRTVSPPTHVLSETPTGPLRIAKEALEAGLRGAGEALPEITRLRVVVDTATTRRVGVQGQFQCAEGVSNLQASQRLRAVLQDRFATMVRVPDGTRVDFDLEFLGFAGKLVRKAGEQPPNLELEPPPFTGPQYPIEEEEHSGGGA